MIKRKKMFDMNKKDKLYDMLFSSIIEDIACIIEVNSVHEPRNAEFTAFLGSFLVA